MFYIDYTCFIVDYSMTNVLYFCQIITDFRTTAWVCLDLNLELGRKLFNSRDDLFNGKDSHKEVEENSIVNKLLTSFTNIL